MSWLLLQVEEGVPWDALFQEPQRASAPLATAWRRALARGAVPAGPDAEPMLDGHQVAMRQGRLDEMLRALDRIIGVTARQLEGLDFTLLFADTDGAVLRRWAGGGFQSFAEQVRLQVGAVWDESIRGTNAIGTALAERRPVMVHGGAHLARCNHGLVCYGAPVRDPWGELLGVLDATSFVERTDGRVPAAITQAALQLEAELRQASLDHVQGRIARRLLDRLGEPAALVSPMGIVTQYNDAAARNYRALQTHPGADLGAFDLGVEVLERSMSADERFEIEPVMDGRGRTAAYLLVGRSRPRTVPRRRAASLERLAGTDPALIRAKELVRKVATSRLPVLVLGGTGTGKELAARGVHEVSDRTGFVPVNCATIQPALLHSELFGYAPGAFTDASRDGAEGLIAQADGGTLFLDELAEMPSEVQAGLLRFLETGTYRRVGEAVARHADVRIVCATSADLESLVEHGQMRADLFYRVQGVVVRMPALAERTDHEQICDALLAELAAEMGVEEPRLSPAALEAVQTASWPGNVRELRMCLTRAMVLSEESLLQPEDLGLSAARPAQGATSLSAAEGRALREALDASKGNVSVAARTLRVARSTLYRMMERHGLR